MRFVAVLVVFLAVFGSCPEIALCQTSRPSAYIQKKSVEERDSDITFEELRFTPGESLDSASARFTKLHRRDALEQDNDEVYLIPFSDVVWQGMHGRGWIEFDSLDRAKRLRLDFKIETFDSLYLRLSRAYSLPDREFFLFHDSLAVVSFHDGGTVIELGLDSTLLFPIVQAWAASPEGTDAQRSRGQQWVRLGGSKNFAAYVDPGTPPSDEVVVKFVDDSEIAAVKIEAAEKYPTLGYDKYAYGLITYKCDCQARTVASLRILHCNSDDKPIYLYPYDAKRSQPWKVGATGFGATLLDYVCGRLKE